MKLWNSFVLFGLVVVFLTACGSRKSELQLSVDKQSLDVKQSESATIETQGVRNVVLNSFDDGYSITPIDPEKPMDIVGPDGSKTSVTNGKIDKRSRKETATIAESVKQKSESEKKTDIKADSYSKDKVKNTERKADWSWLWVMLIIVVLLVVIWLRKKLENIG